MKFGLLGEHLGHSYSPRIHGLLHGEAYGLCEVPPENVEAFLAGTELDGLNVTIPYKRRVMGCCASLSETARKVGCVNTLVRGPEGWRGYNTDYDGFRHLLMAGGLNPAGWKTLVLGSGGASLTARTVLKDLGAAVGSSSPTTAAASIRPRPGIFRSIRRRRPEYRMIPMTGRSGMPTRN